MFSFLLSALLLAAPAPKDDWRTPFEKGNGNTTATYAECLAYYRKLDASYPEITMRAAGPTDCGEPLHEVIVSLDGDAEPASVRGKNRRVVFIQNGIHPGEPEGIDACMALVRDYVQKKELRRQLENVTLVVIPAYNVDGMLSRNSTTRANQNGPEEYGFRGNARNLDLNRDYLKQDSRNARSFAQLFQRWQPDVFVDTHTSDGADYQYTMTLIATQKDKLHPVLGQYLQQSLLPALYDGMARRKTIMTPYVDFEGRTPDARGLVGFLETPRYATGYTTLFNTIGVITETHMLKAYAPRVRAQYDFLDLMVRTVHAQAAVLAQARATAQAQLRTQTTFPLAWRLDTTQAEKITFRGYEGRLQPSAVSGQPRLFYDRTKPYTRSVPYYNTFRPSVSVTRPAAYIIPQAWGEVLERLRLSGVQLRTLTQDTTLTAETYYIADYKTGPRPYEGHYVHTAVELRTEQQPRTFRAGDFVATTQQPAARYLIEALEPQATDSFFAWGFFDSILQQKEYFSDYVFEDIATELLRQDPALRARLEKLKAQNAVFAQSGAAQLDWVYRQSPHYEKSHLRYPIARVID
ncbi:Zinc carboxypeptidase [Hymenobacter daecheongensis DSM 21074]|uniref:Zinc carboxypeptidase n=1 Tax=Hymenobacter daecheongensis DSM 21074 TaxID=1121955 RepID=A0A1M6JP15_9BACT|nr:M14 family metallopeptidase [Hymenobacter daecheongensis]SHJ48451.1 Zinc carboxypeptidase [Hymenobacter daecheongensis DSM 21074]